MRDAPTTHHSLIARLRDDKNSAAWADFVKLYEPAIYRFVRSKGLQDADAQEVVQEVLLNVREMANSPEYDAKSSFRAWLATVTRNRLIDLLRKKSRWEKRLLAGFAAMGNMQEKAEEAWSRQFGLEIRHQMFLAAAQHVEQTVSSDQWQAFWQTAIELQPASAVAKRLGMSVGNLYVSKCRVMEKLRKQIESMSEQDMHVREENA